jgi:CubicO group peptidase (beta-lactamase class C family)
MGRRGRWWRLARAVLVAAGATLVVACTSSAPTAIPTPTASASFRCPTSQAERAALEVKLTAALRARVDALGSKATALRSVLTDVCGVRAHEQYQATTRERTRSIAAATSSVVGTHVGIALADGSLTSVDQRLADLLPTHRSAMSAEVASTTVRQLLTMTAGLDADVAGRPSGVSPSADHFVDDILREGVVNHPRRFAYSSASSHLLSAILAQATGRSDLDYARAKLFGPLGVNTEGAAQPVMVDANIPAYERARYVWPMDHQGVNAGGWGLKIRPQDLARLGQVYCHEESNGQQVVPESWTRAATTDQVAAAGGFGGEHSGYQWWATTAGGHPAFGAVESANQLLERVPDRSVVVVFTSPYDPSGPGLASASAYQVMVSASVVPALG